VRNAGVILLTANEVLQRVEGHTTKPDMNKSSLNEKFALIHEHWRPKVVAQLNGQELKLVRFLGTFPWHHHEREDEMFLVWRGQMTIEFVERQVMLQAGEFYVVPRGVEHRTKADTEAEVIVFEPAETRNTGNIVDPTFTAPNNIAI
jgi:mannose-6-phosphate isomerase-like protein (cupin superfamily)